MNMGWLGCQVKGLAGLLVGYQSGSNAWACQWLRNWPLWGGAGGATAAFLPGLELGTLCQRFPVCCEHCYCMGVDISSARLAGTDVILLSLKPASARLAGIDVILLSRKPSQDASNT